MTGIVFYRGFSWEGKLCSKIVLLIRIILGLNFFLIQQILVCEKELLIWGYIRKQESVIKEENNKLIAE